jgi:hypothetical protein
MPHIYKFYGSKEDAAKWRFGYANLYITCPKCNALPGFTCESPKGRAANSPHTERLKTVPRHVGYIKSI